MEPEVKPFRDPAIRRSRSRSADADTQPWPTGGPTPGESAAPLCVDVARPASPSTNVSDRLRMPRSVRWCGSYPSCPMQDIVVWYERINSAVVSERTGPASAVAGG